MSTEATPGNVRLNDQLGPQVAWTDEQAYHMGRGAYECSVLPADRGSNVKAFWQLTSIQQAGWVARAAVAAKQNMVGCEKSKAVQFDPSVNCEKNHRECEAPAICRDAGCCMGA